MIFVVYDEVNDDSTGKPVDIEKYVKETADSVESIWGGWKYGEDWTCWNNCRKWNFGW